MTSCHVISRDYHWVTLIHIYTLTTIDALQLRCTLLVRTMELRNSPMLLIAVLFLCTVHITTARVLTPCQIARELYEHGIRREQLNDCKYYNTHPRNISSNEVFRRFLSRIQYGWRIYGLLYRNYSCQLNHEWVFCIRCSHAKYIHRSVAEKEVAAFAMFTIIRMYTSTRLWTQIIALDIFIGRNTFPDPINAHSKTETLHFWISP